MYNKNRLRNKSFIWGGALAALLLAVCVGMYFRSGETTEPAEQQEVAESDVQELLYDAMEVGEVTSSEYGAHTFIDQDNPPSTQYPDDGRSVFKIIEVIPHDICSVFPYLVEWGTPEEYDKNVPVGYEGLMAISKGGGAEMFYGKDGVTNDEKSYFYTMIELAFKQSTLNEYSHLTFGGSTQADWGNWYILSDSSLSSAVDGYFEFVGNGKGLFYIATSYADGKHSTDKEGIHHRTRAVPRSGLESAKGDMYLEGAAVYLSSRNHSRAEIGTNYTPTLLSQTADNYDLSFAADEVNGKYHADMSNITSKNNGSLIGYDWDYILVVDDPDSWSYGFEYGLGGGYEVKKATANASGTGAYVRAIDPAKNDAYTDVSLPALPKGYFRLKASGDDGLQTYDVEFQTVAGSTSYYYPLNPPGPFNLSDPAYHFEYAGSGKGYYDVPFLYDGGNVPGNQYTETLIEVSDGEGRYSLTSTAADAAGQPLYAQTVMGAGDYEETITNIQFNTEKTATGTDDDRIGVTKGGEDESSAQYGGWVFHQVSDQDDMEWTPLREVYRSNKNGNSNLNFSIGDRIYVRSQQVQQRFYCRDGFENNEMFKLRGYATSLTHPGESYSLYGYNNNISPYRNKQLKVAETILDSFDASIRIEIVQKTMSKLTVADVESADLLYIAVTPAVENLDKNWSTINEWRVAAGQEPMQEIPAGLPQRQGMAYFPASFNNYGDLKPEVMLSIYKNCVYDRTVALMMQVTAFAEPSSSGKSPTSNSAKLVYMMEAFTDARNFAYFIPGLMKPDVANPNYTRINTDASLTVSGPFQYSWDWDTQYNQEWDDNNKTHVTGAWTEKYFTVRNPSNSSQLLIAANFEQIPAGTNRYDGNGETKLALGEHGPQSVRRSLFFDNKANLYDILSNRNVKTYKLKIVPKNGEVFTDKDGNERWIIYGNEFDPESFEVLFQVWKDEVGGTALKLNDGYIICSSDGGSPTMTVNEKYEPDTTGGTSVDQYTIEGSEVRKGFEHDATSLDPAIYSRKITITVDDKVAEKVSKEVEIIVREGFFLN